MKASTGYSRAKFLNFSFDSQVKALRKLLRELEYSLADEKRRRELIAEIRFLTPLCKEELPKNLNELLQELPDDPHRLLRRLAKYQSENTYKDDQLNIRIGDGQAVADPHAAARATQICMIADNLRSVFNVGSLFRVCECLAISELWLCGITPTPEHPNMDKTALGTISRVKWQYFDDTHDALAAAKERGMKSYALETVEPSQNIFEHEFKLPLALVVGNEALGIDPQIVQKCDAIVHLPVLGWKNSLNVSVASSIALYQIIFGNS
ncbi:MAG TPA: RNA methyltransferase [Candidatus Cloacimonetes bacterium]|nr:RNA methyltransferase [Candidatus Cloacimonadota bacterium]